MKRRDPSGWLSLAVRARQWMLDTRSADLQDARNEEARALQAQARMEALLRAAAAERATMLSRERFCAAELGQRVAFEHQLRVGSVCAQREVQRTADASRAISDEMQQLLAQRDAYRKRGARAVERATREREQAFAREADELWLVQQPPLTLEKAP